MLIELDKEKILRMWRSAKNLEREVERIANYHVRKLAMRQVESLKEGIFSILEKME